MKLIINILLLFTEQLLFSQSIDSLAIQQIDSLIRISQQYTSKRNFDHALSINDMAETIALKSFGRESLIYASCCHNHGKVSHLKKDYSDAEKWYIESKNIREKILGNEHPIMANIFNNLAILYKDMDQDEKAEILYLEVLKIRKNVLGKDHPEYAWSLNNLANFYKKLWQYEKAEPIYLEALKIFEKSIGSENQSYIPFLNNLANLYNEMDYFEKAELLYLKTKIEIESQVDIKKQDLVQNMLGLADLYNKMNIYEKAEKLYVEAKDICEKSLGKDHQYYHHLLNSLSILYMKIGMYNKAESICIEIKTIREKELGKTNAYYANIINNMAILYNKMGQFNKAESLFIEAKVIREKYLGKDHPAVANSLLSLAIYYRDLEQFEKALPCIIEAKNIWEKSQRKDNLDYSKIIDNMANVYYSLGYFDKAENIYKELSYINKQILRKSINHLSEKEMNEYLTNFSENLEQILSFTQTSKIKSMYSTCYDNSLFYKGFLQLSVNRIRVLSHSDSSALEKFKQLKGFQRALSILYSKSITPQDRTKLSQLESKVNDLEKDLVLSVGNLNKDLKQTNWKEIQSILKSGEATIEFVHYHYFSKKKTDSTMYSAIVLRPFTDQPILVPLFEEKQLDSLLQTNNEKKVDYVNKLYTLSDRGAITIEAQRNSLYNLIWKPLEKELYGIKTIYFSPSGLLHRINLDAIPISESETLADRIQLIEFNSTRQLIIPTEIKSPANDAILFGGIQYEQDSTIENTEPLLASRDKVSYPFHQWIQL